MSKTKMPIGMEPPSSLTLSSVVDVWSALMVFDPDTPLLELVEAIVASQSVPGRLAVAGWEMVEVVEYLTQREEYREAMQQRFRESVRVATLKAIVADGETLERTTESLRTLGFELMKSE
jgi:hypothetical protein